MFDVGRSSYWFDRFPQSFTDAKFNLVRQQYLQVFAVYRRERSLQHQPRR